MQAPLTANRPALSARRLDGVLDWARMLSGLALAAFLLGHTLLAASVLLGPAAMNALAARLEASGAHQLGGPLIFLLFLAHFALVARKLPLRPEEQKTLWQHARLIHHADTWLWLAQAATGAAILLMGAYHMWTVLADLPITALKSAQTLRTESWRPGFYLLLAPLAHAHLGLGLYRIAVKWGFVGRAGRKRFKTFVTVLILACVALSLATLSRLWFLGA